MKKQVRYGVFESNSSSTHSLTITTKEMFDKWKNGEVLFNPWTEEFVDVESMKHTFTLDDVMDFYDERRDRYWKSWEQLSSSEKQEWVNKYKDELEDEYDEDLYTYEGYNDRFGYDYELFERGFVTPSNDRMVAFGHYGYMG